MSSISYCNFQVTDLQTNVDGAFVLMFCLFSFLFLFCFDIFVTLFFERQLTFDGLFYLYCDILLVFERIVINICLFNGRAYLLPIECHQVFYFYSPFSFSSLALNLPAHICLCEYTIMKNPCVCYIFVFLMHYCACYIF